MKMDRINKILDNEDYKKLMNKIKENEKDRRFCRHDLSHCMDVARIAWIINLEEQSGTDKELIYAAALLHDIGRADACSTGEKHHIISIRYAEAILKNSDFSEDEIKEILNAISMHNSGDMDMEGLSGLLYRADKLSRLCFSCDAYDECYWKDDDKNKGVSY